MSEEKTRGSYALGRVAQLEDLVDVFKKKAGESFALGQRQAADLQMETAEEINVMAKIARQQYDKDYPKRK